jgi:hypothetical protein
MKMSSNNIEIIIPKDRLNDFRYIQYQLIDAKCEMLQTVAIKKNLDLNDLVSKFLPELNPVFYKGIYVKYGLKYNEDD